MEHNLGLVGTKKMLMQFFPWIFLQIFHRFYCRFIEIVVTFSRIHMDFSNKNYTLCSLIPKLSLNL